MFGQKTAHVTVQVTQPKQQISKHVYGHFAEHLGRCIYDGFWVDPNLPVEKQGRIRMDIVKALRDIDIPNLRWPGGCYADEYQWIDGVGKPEDRPVTINSHWGGVTEDNSFGTHEFLELCELLGCDPYISANVGSGTPEQMRDWIEYLNFAGESTLAKQRAANGHPEPYGVSFWGIGNESWGCGGNMTPEFYSDQYRLFQTYARDYSGNRIRKIACGPNGADYNWMEVCMKNIRSMWGISLHHYTIATGNWGKKGSATTFKEDEYFGAMKSCLFMEELLQKHTAIMDRYDTQQRVGLVVDEWGIWTDVEPGTNPGFLYQQNSLRDALIAGSTLNIFNNYSHRVRMANLAQTINVLQALILTDKEKMLLTPTYHVFKMYKVHQDAKLLPSFVDAPKYVYGEQEIDGLNASASIDENGVVHISLVNLNPTTTLATQVNLNGYNAKSVKGEVLTSKTFTDYNSFDQPNKIKAAEYKDFKQKGDLIEAQLPPMSVVVFSLK
ncbi:alpha-N-arabinofuranosidase [Parabacteroides sp. OttesenSCG-928-O15]|nr:alpha-N-arabinofuranosidase [Parabacteroides sp. OttesenSCG-928-O15]